MAMIDADLQDPPEPWAAPRRAGAEIRRDDDERHALAGPNRCGDREHVARRPRDAERLG